MQSQLQDIIEQVVAQATRNRTLDSDTFDLDFHQLTRKQKRVILSAYMDSTKQATWGDLVEGMSNTKLIAGVMHDYLLDRAQEDVKRLLLKNRVLELLEVGMFDALADRVQPLIDQQVKEKLQAYADSMRDEDGFYLFA